MLQIKPRTKTIVQPPLPTAALAPGTRRQFSTDDWHAIEIAYRRGFTAAWLGKYLSCSPSTVSKRAKRMKWKRDLVGHRLVDA